VELLLVSVELANDSLEAVLLEFDAFDESILCSNLCVKLIYVRLLLIDVRLLFIEDFSHVTYLLVHVTYLLGNR